MEKLKDEEIDFLNSSAVGPTWIKYFTYLGEPAAYIAMIPLFMFFWRLPVGVVYSFTVVTSLFLTNWFKEMFADSRPLWFAGADLEAGDDGCSTEYGQPSMHAMGAVNFFVLPLVFFTITHNNVNKLWKGFGYIFCS